MTTVHEIEEIVTERMSKESNPGKKQELESNLQSIQKLRREADKAEEAAAKGADKQRAKAPSSKESTPDDAERNTEGSMDPDDDLTDEENDPLKQPEAIEMQKQV